MSDNKYAPKPSLFRRLLDFNDKFRLSLKIGWNGMISAYEDNCNALLDLQKGEKPVDYSWLKFKRL